MNELMELRENLPAVFELEKKILMLDFESERLGEEIRGTRPEKGRAEKIEELTKMLEEIFDLKQERNRLEAEQIERELREIRAMIQKREDNRRMIIGRRAEDLAGGEDIFEW